MFRYLSFCLSLTLAAGVFGFTAPASAQNGPGSITGFGILGDSSSDEYQTDDDRGGQFHNVTFNYVEILQRLRGLDFGTFNTFPEPRRTGYAYNWARSGAAANSLEDRGMVSGVINQIQAGEVSHVFIFIGENDFAPAPGGPYEMIYNGTMTNAELQAKINGIVADFTDAVDQILAAGQVGIVLATIGNPANSPQVREAYPDPTGRQRVTNAINSINTQLANLAQSRNIGLANLSQFSNEIAARVNANGILPVAGVGIDTVNPGDEPNHLRLLDGHGGTVLMGLFANEVFIESFNQRYNLGLTKIPEQQIVTLAGLTDGNEPGPTPTPTPTPTPDPGTPLQNSAGGEWAFYQ